MNDSVSSVTSVSLLAQIGRDRQDPVAWRRFVDRYGKRIYEWCLNRQLQPVDAEDVTQEVLLKLAVRLGEFEYDQSQSFRGWLRRITENAVMDFFRQRKARGAGQHAADALERLAHEEAREDLVIRLREMFDLELLDANYCVHIGNQLVLETTYLKA